MEKNKARSPKVVGVPGLSQVRDKDSFFKLNFSKSGSVCMKDVSILTGLAVSLKMFNSIDLKTFDPQRTK
jgi:hypothetical protein